MVETLCLFSFYVIVRVRRDWRISIARFLEGAMCSHERGLCHHPTLIIFICNGQWSIIQCLSIDKIRPYLGDPHLSHVMPREFSYLRKSRFNEFFFLIMRCLNQFMRTSTNLEYLRIKTRTQSLFSNTSKNLYLINQLPRECLLLNGSSPSLLKRVYYLDLA